MKKFFFLIFLLVGMFCNTANSIPKSPNENVQECSFTIEWTTVNRYGNTCTYSITATASTCTEARNLALHAFIYN